MKKTVKQIEKLVNKKDKTWFIRIDSFETEYLGVWQISEVLVRNEELCLFVVKEYSNPSKSVFFSISKNAKFEISESILDLIKNGDVINGKQINSFFDVEELEDKHHLFILTKEEISGYSKALCL